MMSRTWLLLAALMFIGGLLCGCSMTGRADDTGMSIVTAEDNFALSEPGDGWTFRTPEMWKINVEGDRRFLQMAPPTDRPVMSGVRRVQEYGIYNKYEWRSFWLSFWVRVDRDVAVKARDACVILGRQDNTHMYYVHLSGASDGVHTTVMRVDGETRQVIVPAGYRPAPPIPDLKWHKVDILRDGDKGTITVKVDAFDENAPALFEIKDKTYEWGYVGIGSWDDHASFAKVLIQGQARKPVAPLVVDEAD